MNAPRRHRDRGPARRDSFRDPKPILLVVCEGAVTEREYLLGLANQCRNSRVQVKISDIAGRDPKSLVEEAKSLKKKAEEAAEKRGDDNLAYDQVWCLHDIDDHPGEKLAGASDMARDNGILLAVSNPCVELWLYLHFENTGPIDRKKLASLLKKRIPKYDKHVRFEDYEAGLEDAIKRSKTLDKLAKNAGDTRRNPTTGVHRLVEEIRKVSSAGRANVPVGGR